MHHRAADGIVARFETTDVKEVQYNWHWPCDILSGTLRSRWMSSTWGVALTIQPCDVKRLAWGKTGAVVIFQNISAVPLDPNWCVRCIHQCLVHSLMLLTVYIQYVLIWFWGLSNHIFNPHCDALWKRWCYPKPRRKELPASWGWSNGGSSRSNSWWSKP